MKTPILAGDLNIPKPSCLISCSHWLPEGNLSVLVGRHGAMNPAGRVRGRDNMVAAHIRVGRLTPEGLANRGLVGFRAAPFPPLRSGPTHSISRSPSRGCPCGGGGIPTACMSEP